MTIRGGKRPNAGRKAGVQNKLTLEIKDMIRGALANVGGQEYLERQAEENPVAFMGLIKAIIPSDVNLSSKDGIKFTLSIGNDKND